MTSAGPSDVARPLWRLSLATDPNRPGYEESGHENSAHQNHGYEVARLELESTIELALPWTLRARGAPGGAETCNMAVDRRPVWDGRGWLGGTWRPVRSFEGTDGYDLEIEDFGRASVRPSHRLAQWVPDRPASEVDGSLVQEVLLGPVLALMLAQEGTFCLHGGCVRIGDSVVGLLGESGVGKSTLSRTDGADWIRIGDDVFAVSGEGSEVYCRFPQLKLPQREQYPGGDPFARPLAALFELDPETESAADCPIEGERLASREATLAIVRHTVASKLFGPRLLAAHLTWCEALARLKPVYRWCYPHDLDRIGEVREAIARQSREND